jgi:peptidoglycan/LPS O-acetylase OafA/YrhL
MSPKKAPYFQNLDGLRGLAIGIVLLHHCHWGGETLATLCENGKLGVDLFFAISGFLICSLFLIEGSKAPHIDLQRFFARRITRLFPLYYAVLGLYCVLIFGFGFFSPENQALFREKLPSYLFYYSNLLPIGAVGPFFFAWSLAVEEQFYLLYGLLFRYAAKGVVIGVLLGSLFAKIGYYNGLFGAPFLPVQWELILFSYREPILAGVLLAFALQVPAFERLFRSLFGGRLVCGLLTVLWCTWLFFWEVPGRSHWIAQAFYLFSTLLVGSAALAAPVAGLSGRVLIRLGLNSYGVYLMHMLYINALFKVVDDPFIVFCGTLALCYSINTVIFEHFEKPVMFWGRRQMKA